MCTAIVSAATWTSPPWSIVNNSSQQPSILSSFPFSQKITRFLTPPNMKVWNWWNLPFISHKLWTKVKEIIQWKWYLETWNTWNIHGSMIIDKNRVLDSGYIWLPMVGTPHWQPRLAGGEVFIPVKYGKYRRIFATNGYLFKPLGKHFPLFG